VRAEAEAVAAPRGDQLAGMSFVITGTLAGMSREQAAEVIVAHGGKVTGSVTRKTSYLLIGSDPGGNKYSKALELDVPLLDEPGLLAMLGDVGAQAVEAVREPPTRDPGNLENLGDGQLTMDL
jgi:DNA ligase (NAD+)